MITDSCFRRLTTIYSGYTAGVNINHSTLRLRARHSGMMKCGSTKIWIRDDWAPDEKRQLDELDVPSGKLT
jgi:hypothetical protein